MAQFFIDNRYRKRCSTRPFCAVAIILIGAAAMSSEGFAQSRDLDFKALNDRRAPPPKAKESRRKACAEYGAGFYRLEGSDTCMRIGGGIDVTVGSGRGLSEAPLR